MTDLEEIPDGETPMMYERLKNIQPASGEEPEAGVESVKKVLHRVDSDEPKRLGGLSD